MPLNQLGPMLNNQSKSTGETLMIKIFSKPNCPYCERAKSYLTSLNIEYDTIDITKNPMAHSFLVKEGHRSVPQFYVDETLLFNGGYQELVKYSREQINEMIGEPINVNQLGVQI